MAGVAAIMWFTDDDLADSSIYHQTGDSEGMPTSDAESHIPDSRKIEFGTGASVPDSRTHFVSISPRLARKSTDNPAPFEDNPRKPDTGFRGSMFEISLFFNEDGGRSKAIARLLSWVSRNNTTAKFRKGRVGIRIDARPESQISFLPIPGQDGKGYKIIEFDFFHDLQHPTITVGTITLEQQGVLA